MKYVCLMIGHRNIGNITSEGLRSWRSATNLKKSTGSAGESDWMWNKLMPLLRDKLIAAGVGVIIADATYQKEVYNNKNYDLWVSLHWDAGNENNRCLIGVPNRSESPAFLNPKALDESDRFAAIWKETYPNITGTVFNTLETEGMDRYYGYDYTGMDTPSVLIEHFNATSPKGKELIANPDIVANADVASILSFLGIEPKLPTSPEPPEQTIPAAPDTVSPKIEELGKRIDAVAENVQKIVDINQKQDEKVATIASKVEEFQKFTSEWQSQLATANDFISQMSERIGKLEDAKSDYRRLYENLLPKTVEKATIKSLVAALLTKASVKTLVAKITASSLSSKK